MVKVVGDFIRNEMKVNEDRAVLGLCLRRVCEMGEGCVEVLRLNFRVLKLYWLDY